MVETQYCIALSRISEEFYPEISANEAQREEWVNLFAIDEIRGDLTTPGYSKNLRPEFLKAHPTLMIDTRHFDANFKARVIEAVGDLHKETVGVLFHGENTQALSLLRTPNREQIDCAFSDPPYNTGSDDFNYPDSYQHSSWLAMLGHTRADGGVPVRTVLF